MPQSSPSEGPAAEHSSTRSLTARSTARGKKPTRCRTAAWITPSRSPTASDSLSRATYGVYSGAGRPVAVCVLTSARPSAIQRTGSGQAGQVVFDFSRFDFNDIGVDEAMYMYTVVEASKHVRKSYEIPCRGLEIRTCIERMRQLRLECTSSASLTISCCRRFCSLTLFSCSLASRTCVCVAPANNLTHQ